jgi:ATP-dependent RNA circularization protein (DNA/RNA ligase family)
MVNKYPKIKTVFLRDPENKYKTLLDNQYAIPEFEYLRNNKWIFTEKIDGTNIRIMWDGEHLMFGGRTDAAQIPTFLFSKLQELFTKEQFMELYSELPMCLYGEGYGAKIQKGGGKYITDGVSFILFDVLVGNIWLERFNVEDIASKLKIDCVPIIGSGTLYDGIEVVRSGLTSTFGNFVAEGLVMRPEIELLKRNGSRIITKIKYKDFGEKS